MVGLFSFFNVNFYLKSKLVSAINNPNSEGIVKTNKHNHVMFGNPLQELVN